ADAGHRAVLPAESVRAVSSAALAHDDRAVGRYAARHAVDGAAGQITERGDLAVLPDRGLDAGRGAGAADHDRAVRRHAECKTLHRIAARRETETGDDTVLPAERLVAAGRTERFADHHRAIEGRVVTLALVILAGDRAEPFDAAVLPAKRFGIQMDSVAGPHDDRAIARQALREAAEQGIARQVADAFERGHAAQR